MEPGQSESDTNTIAIEEPEPQQPKVTPEKNQIKEWKLEKC